VSTRAEKALRNIGLFLLRFMIIFAAVLKAKPKSKNPEKLRHRRSFSVTEEN
jgi:hypothetical protein